MSQPFDYDVFGHRAALIMLHSKGKSFRQLTAEVAALEKEYESVRDRLARTYIRRCLDRWLFQFSINTSQPPVVVARLYRQLVRRRFETLHREVSALIEYAEYLGEHGDYKKGLRVLHRVKRKITAGKEAASDCNRGLLQPIEESMRRLEMR